MIDALKGEASAVLRPAGNFLSGDKKSPKTPSLFAQGLVRRQHVHVLTADRAPSAR
jgi:hypothetical protein